MKPKFSLILVALLGFSFQNALANDKIGITLENTKDTVCFGGEDASFTYTDTIGSPESLHVEFPIKALSNGFKNTVIQIADIANNDSTFFIAVPDTAMADNYSAILYVKKDEIQSDPQAITIIVLAQPYAGEDSTLRYCEGETITKDDLFKALGEGVDSDGTWEPAIDEQVEEITYTYTVTAISPCEGKATAEIKVEQVKSPYAGEDSTLRYCEGETIKKEDIINAIGEGADPGGEWFPPLEGQIADTIYTYTVEAFPCTNAIARIEVEQIKKPYAGEDSTLRYCEGETITKDDLFKALGEGADSDGTWEPAIDEQVEDTTYTYTVTAYSPCEGKATAEIKVEQVKKPYAGEDSTLRYCEGETIKKEDIINALGEGVDPSGEWFPPLEGQIADTIYTYTVKASPCTDALANVTVKGIPLPEMGSILTKPAGDVSVIIFQDFINIEEILLFREPGVDPDTLTLESGGYLYIEPQYRVAEYIFKISFHKEDGCSNVVDYTYSELGTVSINEFTVQGLKQNDYNLYPNPAKNHITIVLHPILANTSNDLWTRIFSLSGSCVLEAKLEGNNQSIKLENLKPGVYFVQLSGSDLLLGTRKLIISK